MKATYRLKKQYYGKYKHFLNYKVYVYGEFIGKAQNKEDAYKLVIKVLKKEIKELSDFFNYPM